MSMTMTAPPDITELVDPTNLPRQHPARSRPFLWMAIGLGIIVAIVFAVGQWVLSDQSEALTEAIAERQELLARSRVEVVQTWMDGTLRLADQMVAADTFRLFAKDSDPDNETDPAIREQVVAQTSYMLEWVLGPFVQNNGLQAAYLVTPAGRTTLMTRQSPALEPDQLAMSDSAARSASPQFAPARMGRDGLVVDVFVPVRDIAPLQPAADPPVVGVFIMTVPVDDAVASFTTTRPLISQPGERTYLLQVTESEIAALSPRQGTPEIQPIDLSLSPSTVLTDGIPFAARTSAFGSTEVLSIGVPVPGLPWVVLKQVSTDSAMAPLNQTRNVVLVLSLLVTLAVGATLLAVWFNQANAYNAALARQFRDLAARIDAQRRLLGGINGAIVEMIGLKRPDGTYAYVNPAFADAVGRPANQLLGQTDEAIFGHGSAARLAQSDRKAMERGVAIAAAEQMYLGGHQCYLEISKVPLVAEGGEVDGIVSVLRDVTELVEERHRREAALRHTIDALVKTIELADPYLAGHSKLTQRISIMIARHLAMTDQEIATLEVAATVCQIGKVFIDRSILTKPDRLTPEENEVMQRHIVFAGEVLKEIDFELPICDTIQGMYERLDGSGYPNKLQGDAIGMSSRILGVADVFSARIRPRSYRSAIGPKDALKILQDHGEGRYDRRVIDALGAVFDTTEGEELMASVEGLD